MVFLNAVKNRIYLKNHREFYVVNGEVPQDTSLGPLFFGVLLITPTSIHFFAMVVNQTFVYLFYLN